MTTPSTSAPDAAQRRDRLAKRVGLDVADDDPGALGREPPGERVPDAARAASDDRDFAGEILHGRMLTPGRAVSAEQLE